jgi:TrmH family RNA methyltransferase
VKYTELAGFIKQNPEKTVYASVLDGEDLHEKIGANDALLVIGNESKGISSSLESLATRKIRIPRAGGAESLNVAVATGILLSYLEPFR